MRIGFISVNAPCKNLAWISGEGSFLPRTFADTDGQKEKREEGSKRKDARPSAACVFHDNPAGASGQEVNKEEETFLMSTI
jgi:hypothetical protein